MLLHQLLTPDDIFAEILMLRTMDPRVFVLAESEYDCQVIDVHLNDVELVSVPCNGKTAVISILDKAALAGVSPICAIVDADFDRIVATATRSNVFMTDHADLDSEGYFRCAEMIAHLRSFMAPAQASAESALDLQEAIKRVAYAIGALRFASITKSWGLKLDNPPLRGYFRPKPGVLFDVTGFTTTILSRSPLATVSASDLEAVLTEALTTPAPLILRMCNGHDVCRLAAEGVRSLGGHSLKGDVFEQLVKSKLHDCSVFKSLVLHRDAQIWAASNGIEMWHEACA